MSKKTRKDKIAASIYKQKRINSDTVITKTQPELEKSTLNTSYSISQPILKKEPSTQSIPSAHIKELHENTSYFRSDIEKSLWIIFTLLVIELGFYYANLHGLLKFI